MNARRTWARVAAVGAVGILTFACAPSTPPETVDRLLREGLRATAEGRLDHAERWLSAAVAAAPARADVWDARATARLGLNQPDEALKD